MDFDQLLRLGQITAIVFSAALNVYLFLKTRNSAERKEALAIVQALKDERRSGDSALHKRVDAMQKYVNDRDTLSVQRNHYLQRRLSVIETQVAHLATKEGLAIVRSEVAALGERSRANNEMLHSIQKHLMGDD